MIQRMIEAVQRRVANMIARAVVSLVADADGLQIMQLDVLEGETRTDCERFQNYGMTSRPVVGADAVVVFPGGDRATAYVIAVDDRRYRLRNLQAGEVAIYSHDGTYVLLKTGGTIEANKPIDLVAGGVLKVAGIQVVGAQQGSISNPSGGGTVDAAARTAIVSILSALRAHGLIS